MAGHVEQLHQAHLEVAHAAHAIFSVFDEFDCPPPNEIGLCHLGWGNRWGDGVRSIKDSASLTLDYPYKEGKAPSWSLIIECGSEPSLNVRANNICTPDEMRKLLPELSRRLRRMLLLKELAK